jgi:DNA-directed RNA polymerase subunit RPC12/RpoP
MIEKNQIDENETRIKNTIATRGKYDHTTGYYYSYSCKACGNPFSASPPDDVHKFSSVYQCWKFDWIERSYRCHECGNTTTLYWHPRVHKHHDYTPREEINRKVSKDNNLGNNTTADYLQRMVGY